jgi:hypothetical protein
LLIYRQVWLGLGVSIACVIAMLNLIQRYLHYRSTIDDDLKQIEENNSQKGGRIGVKKWQTGKQFFYVLGNLLSQGYYYWFTTYSFCRGKNLETEFTGIS